MSQGTGKVSAKAVGRGNTFSSDQQQVSSKIPLLEDNVDNGVQDLSEGHARLILGHDKT